MSQCLETGVVSWTHTAGVLPVGLHVVVGNKAYAAGRADAFLVPGFGETEASATEGVMAFEEADVPAVAGYFSQSTIWPITRAGLLKLAIDAPQRLAEYAGGGGPVHWISHSLGSLTLMGAASAPELCEAIAMDSPHALACNTWGRIPLIGSIPIFRPLGAANRLLVKTGWQLRQDCANPAYRGVIHEGMAEIGRFGLAAWSTATFGCSNEIVTNVADACVALSESNHRMLVVAGEKDRVTSPADIRSTLRAAALGAGLMPDYFDDKIHVVPEIGHVPWCMRQARQKLDILAKWLLGEPLPASLPG